MAHGINKMADKIRLPRKFSFNKRATSVAMTRMDATDTTVKLALRATDSQKRESEKILSYVALGMATYNYLAR